MRRKKLESRKLLSSVETRKPQHSEAQLFQEKDNSIERILW